ncbi:MAG: addiction module antidote protein [Hyphomicrobium sp.]
MAKTKLSTRPFDPAEYLDDEDAIAAYLDEALATDNAAFIADAIGVVARARGMTQIAKDAGLTRESLYKALSSDGNPEFATILKVLRAMGLRLSVEKQPA